MPNKIMVSLEDVEKAVQEEGDRISWQGFHAEDTFARSVSKNLKERSTTLSPVFSAPYGNSCNRHDNCIQAEKDWLNNHHMEKFVPCNFHCHDDECEDCFGC